MTNQTSGKALRLNRESGCVFTNINGTDWFLFSTSGELTAKSGNDISDLYWSDVEKDSAEKVRQHVSNLIKAVNSHNALCAALKDMVADGECYCVNSGEGNTLSNPCAYCKALATLAEIEKE